MRSRMWSRLAAVIGSLLALAGCHSSTAARPPADALAAVRWADHVRDCAVEHGGSGRGTRIDQIVKGDATGDGRVDTLVVDECESVTSAWPQVVEVFDGASDPANPVRLGALLDGDPDGIRNIVISVEPGGRVVVTGVGLSSNAPACCPDLVVRKVFTYTGHAFALTASTVGPTPSPT